MVSCGDIANMLSPHALTLIEESTWWCREGHCTSRQDGCRCRGCASWSPWSRPTAQGPHSTRGSRHQLTLHPRCVPRHHVGCSALRGFDGCVLLGFGALLPAYEGGLWPVVQWSLRWYVHSSPWPLRCSRWPFRHRVDVRVRAEGLHRPRPGQGARLHGQCGRSQKLSHWW